MFQGRFGSPLFGRFHTLTSEMPQWLLDKSTALSQRVFLCSRIDSVFGHTTPDTKGDEVICPDYGIFYFMRPIFITKLFPWF